MDEPLTPGTRVHLKAYGPDFGNGTVALVHYAMGIVDIDFGEDGIYTYSIEEIEVIA